MSTEVKIVENDLSEGISLKELIQKIKKVIQFFFRKLKPIFLTGLLGSVLGFAIAYFNKPIYTATTTFVLEAGEGSNKLAQYSGLASMIGVDIGSGGGIFQGDNIIELYKSRAMIEKALLSRFQDRSNALLIDRYIKATHFKIKNDGGTTEIPISFLTDSEGKDPHINTKITRLKDSIIGVIVKDINKKYLVVDKPDKKLSIIQVDVKFIDEVFAKSFNEALVRNVNEFYTQTKTKKSLENIAILKLKTDSVRNLISRSINSSATVADATPNLNPTRLAQRTVPTQNAQFSVEANKSILAELVKNFELSKMSLLNETPLIQTIDKPTLPLEKQQKSKFVFIILGFVIFSLVAFIYLMLKNSLDEA